VAFCPGYGLPICAVCTANFFYYRGVQPPINCPTSMYANIPDTMCWACLPITDCQNVGLVAGVYFFLALFFMVTVLIAAFQGLGDKEKKML